MNEVKVNVYSKQIYETHDDVNETKFDGSMALKNNSIYVTFKDEEVGVRTIVKTKDGVVYVKRQGALSGNLEFNTNKSHKTVYFTPYGELDIEIITKTCDIYRLEKGIKIYIDYKIVMQGKTISDNIYMITAN